LTLPEKLRIYLMRKMTISVTDAARNFTDCVNRVRYQNVTFVLVKNGAAVARLVPDREKVCTGRDLAKALARTRLSSAKAATWHRELRAARKFLKSPMDEWQVAGS
jgi:antitoxin (DNA-binding transcriptional repressor) of toxin-antitoxin stability system